MPRSLDDDAPNRLNDADEQLNTDQREASDTERATHAVFDSS